MIKKIIYTGLFIISLLISVLSFVYFIKLRDWHMDAYETFIYTIPIMIVILITHTKTKNYILSFALSLILSLLVFATTSFIWTIIFPYEYWFSLLLFYGGYLFLPFIFAQNVSIGTMVWIFNSLFGKENLQKSRSEEK